MNHFLFLKKRRLGGINSKKDTKIKKILQQEVLFLIKD